MSLDRREFLSLAAGGVLASASMMRLGTPAAQHSAYKAIAFDAFPIFDPRPVFALAETLFPGRGTDLSNAWRARQFEYQWQRALARQYADFWKTTEDGLVYAANLLQLELTPRKRTQLMQAYLALTAWPDVASSLNDLREAGIRLALLSNMTSTMLEDSIQNAGLNGVFEHVLSTDRIRTYKPDPRAYQLAIDAFKVQRQDIVFAAFAGWDAAGAKWFGYPTVWVNRLNSPLEELGVKPDTIGRDLSELTRFVRLIG